MKALAARRHDRRAPVVLLLLALLLVGGLYAALQPASASAAPQAASANDVTNGQKLFAANCATCHGTGATGTAVAPSLVGVGAAAVDFQVGTGRMPMALSGPQAQAKPVVFTPEQISQLAAYVASLGPGPAVPTAEQVDASKGDPANGMAIFRTNCAMCHNAVGAGGALTRGKFAPKLTGVAPEHIYEAMVTGPQSMPVFNDANLSPTDKRDIIAYLTAVSKPSPGGFKLGAIGPVSEGLLIWVLGLGVVISLTVWLTARRK